MRDVAALLEARGVVAGGDGTLRLSVESVDAGTVALLVETLGVGEPLPRYDGRTLRWRVSGVTAAGVLWATLPYLRTDEAREVWSAGFLLASLRGRQRVAVAPWHEASRRHAAATLGASYARLRAARLAGRLAPIDPRNPDLVLVRPPRARRGYNGPREIA